MKNVCKILAPLPVTIYCIESVLLVSLTLL